MTVLVPTRSAKVSKGRLLLFASGDFAFNLYWQSVMLYLLYYYTEALHLSLTIASLGYALASVWDGVISLIVGVLADRYARPERFRFALTFGAVPLGLSFILAYAPPPVTIGWHAIWILAGHVIFRTAYALVNIPYLAMSSRICIDSNDRAFVAGARMLFGTVAAVIIALGTIPLGGLLTGASGSSAYAASAIVFAAVSSLILVVVGLTYRDDVAIPVAANEHSFTEMMRHIVRNQAFLALSAAVMAMIVAVTVLDKSVLYYFKYALHDEAAGQLTLGWMMAVSGIAIPLWLALSRKFGARGVWFIAILACLTCLSIFVVMPFEKALPVQIFLVAVQGSIVGLHFAFWAILPDTVEYGQRASGVRAEAVLYGLSALFQRLAIGLGTVLVGIGLSGEGMHHAEVGDAAYKLVLAFIPMGFFLLAALFMLANPLRRGRHAQILAELGARQPSD
jgi:GPH family glycoside/pentoside/hexuronide:cation symporter